MVRVRFGEVVDFEGGCKGREKMWEGDAWKW